MSKQDNFKNFFKALLKAKSKNHLEEIKLKKWVRDLDMVRKHNDRLLFNEMFEQKREAYRLSYENKEIQKKKHEEDSENRRAKAKEARKHMPKLKEENEDVEAKADASEKPDSSRLPNIRKLRRESTQVEMKVRPRGESMGSLPRLSRTMSSGDLPLGASAINLREVLKLEPVIHEQKEERPHRIKRRRTKSFTHDESFPNVIDRLLGAQEHQTAPGATQQTDRQTSVSNHTKSGAISQGPYPLYRMNSLPELSFHKHDTRGGERKEAPAAAHHQEEKTRSEGNKAGMLGERSNTFVEMETVWVGDPRAIYSVRRPRIDIEDMTARNKSVGDLRRLIRDTPRYPLCSRNCNRPGAEFEGMVNDLTPMPASKIKADLKKEMREREEHLMRCPDVVDERQEPILSFAAAMMLVSEIRESSNNPHALVPTTRELHKAVQDAVSRSAVNPAVTGDTEGGNNQTRVTKKYHFKVIARRRRQSTLETDLGMLAEKLI